MTDEHTPPEPDDRYAYDLSTRIHAGLDQVRQLYGSRLADLLTLMREEMRLYAADAARKAAQEAGCDRSFQPFVYPLLPPPQYPTLPHYPALYTVGDDPNAQPSVKVTCEAGGEKQVTITYDAATRTFSPGEPTAMETAMVRL